MFEVKLDELDIPMRAGDVPAGRIWMVLDGIDFPDERWSDFPISVLGSAVDAVAGLAAGGMEAFSYFFDGPYYVYYKKDRFPTTVSYELRQRLIVVERRNCWRSPR
jgi:hypothetical protein